MATEKAGMPRLGDLSVRLCTRGDLHVLAVGTSHACVYLEDHMVLPVLQTLRVGRACMFSSGCALCYVGSCLSHSQGG